jgi:hypothetical protein
MVCGEKAQSEIPRYARNDIEMILNSPLALLTAAAITSPG